MGGHFEVYEHALISARAKRALLALVTAFAVVLGPWSVPAHAADGLVTGTVTDAEGNPLPGVQVVVYRLHNTSSPHFDPLTGDVTDANGDYALGASAGTVRVQFYGTDDHAGEWYDDAATLADATDVPVPGGGIVTASAELAEYGSLEGHVDRQPGDPQERSVALRDPATGAVRERAPLGESGDYSFPQVAPGSYKVSFNRLSGMAFSAAQFWEATAEHSGLGTADVVTVGAAETVSGIDATLVEGGHITGSLRNGGGTALSCRVQAFTTDGSLVTRSVVSGSDGSFDIGGLSTGSYLVRVVPSGGCHSGVQYRQDGGGALTRELAQADPVAVTLGSTSTAGAALVYDVPPQPPVTSTGGGPSIFVWPTPGLPFNTTPVVGSDLMAAVGGWTPSPTSYAYAWLADGVPIPGATTNRYVVAAADLGRLISVRVQASRPGYQTGSATSPPVGPITNTPIINKIAPRIAQPARVGRVVRANAGNWSVPDATYTFTWRTGSTVLHTSSQPQFLVPAEARSQGLTVTVTASKPGFASATATSEATPVQVGRFRIRKTLRVLGDPLVGSTLKLSGKVSPKPAKAVYVWQRDGVPIAGARGKTYTLVAADVGSRITVLVRYNSPGFEVFRKKTRPTVVVRR